MSDSPPYLSPRGDFEKALEVTKKFVADGLLWWKLSANGVISPRLDEEAIAKVLGAKDNPERKSFEKILSVEVVAALNRAAKTPFLSSPVSGKEVPEEAKREFEDRTKLVGTVLLSDSLQHRVLIRRTSKGSSLEELRWDISIKKHDLGVGTVPDIPYATIELVFIPEAADNPFAAIGLGVERNVFTFDCHLGDLDAILRDLTALRDNLKKLTLDS